MKTVSFSGGLKLPVPKDPPPLTVETIPAPETLILPLDQHDGPACLPKVQKGDSVQCGDIIAHSAQAVINAPVSGHIEDTKHTCVLPDGASTPAIRITNDGQDSQASLPDPALKTVGKLFQAGINDVSPQARPLLHKLALAQEKNIHTLIVNGLDEAFVYGGQSTLITVAPQSVLAGIRVLQDLFRAKHALLAVYDHAEQAVNALTEQDAEKTLRIIPCQAKHPQHKDQLLVSALMNREYTPELIPEDLGVSIVSAECAHAVGTCLNQDQTFTHKILTIHGPGQIFPRVASVRLGTSLSQVVSSLGWDKADLGKAILGGPLTGRALPSLDLPVTKKTHMLCLQSKEAVYRPSDTACFKCGYCVQVCPMRLMPFLISGFSESKNLDLAQKHDIQSCIECGCCAYVCPARIPLVQWIQLGKCLIVS